MSQSQEGENGSLPSDGMGAEVMICTPFPLATCDSQESWYQGHESRRSVPVPCLLAAALGRSIGPCTLPGQQNSAGPRTGEVGEPAQGQSEGELAPPFIFCEVARVQ